MTREPTRAEKARAKRQIRLGHAIDRYARSQHKLVLGFDCLFNMVDLIACDIADHAADPHPTSYILERPAKA